MECEQIKVEILSEIDEYLQKIDLFPMNPFPKMRIIQNYVYSKLRWRFSIYPFSETWIKQNIEPAIYKFPSIIRKWLHISISGNITHLKLPKSYLGIDFCSASDIYLQCKLSVRRILKTSKNSDIQHLYSVTSSKNINTDEIIEKVSSNVANGYELKTGTNKLLKQQNTNDIWANFITLKEQSIIINYLTEACNKKILHFWQEMVSRSTTP